MIELGRAELTIGLTLGALGFAQERASRSRTADAWFAMNDKTWQRGSTAAISRAGSTRSPCWVMPRLVRTRSSLLLRGLPRVLTARPRCCWGSRLSADLAGGRPLSALSPLQRLTPMEVKCAVVTGYCGVDSAELCRVRTGDLGRCETAAPSPSHRRVRARYAIAEREANWACISR